MEKGVTNAAEGLEGLSWNEFLGDVHKTGPGDTVRMPRGKAHGIYNRSGATAKCVFAVAPAR